MSECQGNVSVWTTDNGQFFIGVWSGLWNVDFRPGLDTQVIQAEFCFVAGRTNWLKFIVTLAAGSGPAVTQLWAVAVTDCAPVCAKMGKSKQPGPKQLEKPKQLRHPGHGQPGCKQPKQPKAPDQPGPGPSEPCADAEVHRAAAEVLPNDLSLHHVVRRWEYALEGPNATDGIPWKRSPDWVEEKVAQKVRQLQPAKKICFGPFDEEFRFISTKKGKRNFSSQVHWTIMESNWLGHIVLYNRIRSLFLHMRPILVLEPNPKPELHGLPEESESKPKAKAKAKESKSNKSGRPSESQGSRSQD